MMLPAGETRPRDMVLQDLDGVVALHKACFPDYFLTGLGPGILRRFYGLAIEDPSSFAAVLQVVETKQLVGLAVGTLNPGFHTQLMRQNLLRFGAAIVRGFFTSRAVRQGLWERLGFVRRLFRAQADRGLADAGVPPAAGPEARFLDVAVHPKWRGGRNAERLVEFFASRVLGAGAARLGGSVFPENLASLIMYKRLGWNVKKTGPRRVDVWIDREAPPR